MKLGAFSVSLTVKDLEVSKAFYEKLGFEATGGSLEHSYLIMKSGETLIGLFHGMFDKNILTFNPGLTQQCGETDDYTDVRDIQARLRELGVELAIETDADGSGAGNISFMDPDGNPILIDQFS
ncbi:MAG: VOC family protein [Acidobacteria bacterium]|nr:VOC family protein [Acidobacteriota bacterium]